MDLITLSMAKAFAKKQISIGIKTIAFVNPNIFSFTLVDNSVINIAITDFNNFSQEEKNKLTSLDETVLSKLTINESGELLYDGKSIGSGASLTTEQINKINVLITDGDGSKYLNNKGEYSEVIGQIDIIDGGTF